MDNQKPELATLLEDVKTIKSILQNEDAPLPRAWVIGWIVSTAVLLAGLAQYFIPWFRALDFDGKLLYLWGPGFCLVFPLGLLFLHRELRMRGRRVLGQGRVRHLLYARFLVPPAGLALVWMASRNEQFSLEGTILLLISIWQTVVEQLFPAGFRAIPFLFLILGLLEIGFNLTGPEVGLFNTVLTSLTIAYVGLLFWRQTRTPEER